MDVEMGTINPDPGKVLDGRSEAAWNAAVWVRRNWNLHQDASIVELFEREFNCTLDIENRFDPWMVPNWVVFNTEEELTAFLLKWS